MDSGSVVEFIDREKIVCAVVVEMKKLRLRVLTESNREVSLSVNRLSHKCNEHLDLSVGRDKLVQALKEIAVRRKALISDINIQELWEVLNTEQEWIDLETMTAFCFPATPSSDQESAVVRAFFNDRVYFKFNPDCFFPHSTRQVQQIYTRAAETARKNRLIKFGSDWLKRALKGTHAPLSQDFSNAASQIVEILKSIYLFAKESDMYEIGHAILKNADIHDSEMIFPILVKLGVWGENQNVDLLRLKIPVAFPEKVMNAAEDLSARPAEIFAAGVQMQERRNLQDLELMTIDGHSTLDFDDAISITAEGDQYLLGVHIADVGHFVKKGDPLDQEAMARGSAIYMPDRKISMFPASLADDLCSLKADKLRPAISVMVRMSRYADIIDYEIFPSLIKVRRQLTYFDVNTIADQDPEIIILYDLAQKFRQWRLQQGAVQITLPEVNIWVDKNGDPVVSRINRESPGRLLVSEIMIMANWLKAQHLVTHGVPAIFRTQLEPKERLYKENKGTLFQNWMQRKRLSRFILSHAPEPHSGLGLETYVTATSPIRKYFDLATQRQLRAVLGLEEPYGADEIEHMLQVLQTPMEDVIRVQNRRHRYWLLKYLERKVGQAEEAIILTKQRNHYRILLTEYMIECNLPLSGRIELRPEDLVRVTIQHINARKDMLTVYM